MSHRPARHRRYVLATFALALALGVGLAPGTAGATGLIPHSRQPLTDTNRNCDGAPVGTPTKTSGVAVMAQTPRFLSVPRSLVALLSVQAGTPNATYDIRIIQDDANGVVGSCNVVVGKVTTDANGNGVGFGTTPVLTGATKWWVDLNNQQNFADFVDTELAEIA
jgi:hypothetical protein